MTLPEQILQSLQTRTATLPLSSIGVRRGDQFATEREQWPNCDIADGVFKKYKFSDCVWQWIGSPQVRIIANDEAERDTLLDLFIGTLAEPWPVSVGDVTPETIEYRRGGADKTAFVAVVTLSIGPFATRAYDLSTSA